MSIVTLEISILINFYSKKWPTLRSNVINPLMVNRHLTIFVFKADDKNDVIDGDIFMKQIMLM